jgi:hypothetical protein
MDTHDLLAKHDTVKAVLKEARVQLRDGDIQNARRLLVILASEIELRTLSIPLDTYPAAYERPSRRPLLLEIFNGPARRLPPCAARPCPCRQR